MTTVMDSRGVSEPSSAESHLAVRTLHGLFDQQKKRAADEQRRSDVFRSFVLMSRAVHDCTLQTIGQGQEWRAKRQAGEQLIMAAKAFSRVAESLQTVAAKLVLLSLAAECYHLTGAHGKAAKMAALALDNQQHPDTETVVQARLAVCQQVQAGKTLTAATSPCGLLRLLQYLVPAA